MGLSAGARLGPYEILTPIGAGGMGEVYRARDTKLGRDVALKILPEVFASDPDRLARFQREAQVLASLNHPNIAAIHGLEESTPPPGSGHAPVRALVLELVEGLTLDEILLGSKLTAQGSRAGSGLVPQGSGHPLPLEEALPIARQIADALEAAHEHGIIHRDLKPGNIKIRLDGTVKVLDFGLAKLAEPSAADGAGGTGGAGADVLSQSPTLTTPAMTRMGVILGTAAYMSPEQAKGKPLDKRTDIWAFGCVLYEMLTGTRAFGGGDVVETLARIIERSPDLSRLPAGTPASVRRLLERCFQKDPKRRLRDAADARLELDDETLRSEGQTTPTVAPRRTGWASKAAWSLGGVVVGGLVVGLVLRTISAPLPGLVTRFTMTVPAGLRVIGPMAISPDGSTLVYSAGTDSASNQLFAKKLSQLEAAPVRGTEGGTFPFFSPDGAWIAFVAGGAIKRVPSAGGEPVTVTAALDPYGGVWLPDDSILFGSKKGNLMRVSASGEEPRALTELDSAQGEFRHILPAAVPGGRAVLFTVRFGSLTETQRDCIAVVDLETGARRALVDGTGGQVLPSGDMAFVRNGIIWAVPFDSAMLAPKGSPFEIVSGVAFPSNPWTPVVAVGGGSLAYEPADSEGYEQRTLVWVDRSGREHPIDAPARAWWFPTVSPDGRRLGVHIMNSANMDAWIYELDHGPLTRVTYDPGNDGFPLWSPDGKRVAFWSSRAGAMNLYWRLSDLTGPDERLTTSPHRQVPYSWARNGELLVFEESSPDTKADIGIVAIDGDRTPKPIVRGPSDEIRPSVSPDGRWLAYQSNVSGSWEVFVQPFPELDSIQQVSSGGGMSPLWGPSGRELFYRTGRAMVRVPVEIAGRSFRRRNPEVLFEDSYVPEGGNGRSYALAPDGKRFLMLKSEGRLDSEGGAAQIVFIQNWSEELKRNR